MLETGMVVQGDRLTGGELQVVVGTPEWFKSLTEIQSFRYVGPEAAFTARKERAGSGRGDWYWKGYSRLGGVLRRVYLGKTEELTSQKLQEAAVALAPGAGDVQSTAIDQEAKRAPIPGSPLFGLLRTKLSPPPPGGALVIRPRLTERFADGLRRRLVLVAAPAGFGKTTLISEWRAEAGRSTPLAWLSLEEADNDPTRFWLYLIGALQAALPGVGLEAAEWLRAPNPPIPAVLTALLNELAVATADLVLVLDDYHLIESAEIQEGVTFFLEHLPAQVHVVITSRIDPALPLGRLRARGQLLELRAEDLRFTTEEAAAFLRGMGLSLSADAVSALEERTEGWAAGLQLAALSLQGRSDVTDFLRRFSQSDRYLFDYLVSEVLEQQSPALRRFLKETALLDRLHGDLCAAVTGRPDSTQLLEDLVRANLFITPLDEAGGWYRYHHLFGTILRQLLRREEPEALPELHRRAAAWFEAAGLIDEAIEQALAAGAYEMAAGLLAPGAQELLYTGRYASFTRWVDRLPLPTLEHWPALQLHRAWLFLYSGQLEGAKDIQAAAERALSLQVPPELMREVTLYRAQWALWCGDGVGAAALAEEVLRLTPAGSVAQLVPALALKAGGLVIAGDFMGGEATLSEVLLLSEGEEMLQPRVLALNVLGHLRKEQGRLPEAVDALQRVLREAGDRPLFQQVEARFYLAVIYLEWDRLSEAEELLREAFDLAEQLRQPLYTSYGHQTLARLLAVRGDDAGAQSAFEEALRQYRRRSNQRGIRMTQAYQGRVALAAGNWESLRPWAVALELPTPIPHDRHPEAFTLARLLLAEGRGEKALDLLISMLQQAEEAEQSESVLEATMLLALTRAALGDRRQADSFLTQALALAAPGGYLRLFLDEGAPMLELLAHLPPEAGADRILSHRVAAPLQTGPADERAAMAPNLPEALTERERDVLLRLAAGLTNREIAASLYVTEETVKSHVKHLLAKLAVNGRGKAVARARELGLVPSQTE